MQSGGTAVTEGGATDAFTVALTTPPTAPVTITLSHGADVTVSPSTLTFTSINYGAPQSVAVTAVDDEEAEGTHSDTITFRSVYLIDDTWREGAGR